MRGERGEVREERTEGRFDVTYSEWEAGVPDAIKNDPVWEVEAYRLGLFLSDLAWADTTKLLRDSRGRCIADQMFRAVSNISSNVTEGYSRSTGADRARFLEYALGSAREGRDWYYKSRNILKPNIVEHRISISTQIVALLVAMVRNERRRRRINDRKTDEA